MLGREIRSRPCNAVEHDRPMKITIRAGTAKFARASSESRAKGWQGCETGMRGKVKDEGK